MYDLSKCKLFVKKIAGAQRQQFSIQKKNETHYYQEQSLQHSIKLLQSSGSGPLPFTRGKEKTVLWHLSAIMGISCLQMTLSAESTAVEAEVIVEPTA